jgi:hypothetical protein
MSIENRIAKLETAHRDSRVVIMWRHHAETDEQTKTRWCAKHPGEDPDRDDTRVIIIGWADSQPGA